MLVLVLDRQVFRTPPLGRSLNPFTGVVQNENDLRTNKTVSIGVGKPVDVYFDERLVPHLFASNQEDLFFAQGYVTASDRLWQMDFISYVSAGRLSEILGKDLLEYDRTQRRNGMLYAASKSLAMMEKDKETKAALDNYTAGVNAWIDQLSYKDLPVEYKLLDYQPEPWTNLKSVLIIKYMSAILSGYESDVPSSAMRLALGEKRYDELFPNFFLDHDSSSFILNTPHDSLPKSDYLDYSFLESRAEIEESTFNPHLGSNSWAIGKDKSATGNAVLCADPHLNLSLPAIWYEIQLKGDVQNVYGYSIPGVPGVIIGFNEEISWGLTNGSADVIDYHKLILKPDYSAYKYDGKWQKTVMRLEEIKVKNETTFQDTVFYAKQGPIASDARFGDPSKRGFAFDWTLHNPSNELLSFLQINRAQNNEQFVAAIKHYKCPAQNFSYADTEGNIGMYFQGDVLLRKWKDQGKFVLDGSRSDHFEKQVIAALPSAYNPTEGYVYSANNNPLKVLGSQVIFGHYDELRADRIEALLKSKQTFTLNEMKTMQLDNTNRLAEIALPVLLKLCGTMDTPMKKELGKWTCQFNENSHAAVAFDEWWNTIRRLTWDEFAQLKNGAVLPDDLVLLDLISKDPNNSFFDLKSTEKQEKAADIVQRALKLTEKNIGKKQTWGDVNELTLNHLSNLAPLGRLGIRNGGHPSAINAFTRDAGPSLRMVVDMSSRPQGYGIYAGGQSGNPASKHYESFVDDWLKGSYYKLDFYQNKQEIKARYKWTLN